MQSTVSHLRTKVCGASPLGLALALIGTALPVAAQVTAPVVAPTDTPAAAAPAASSAAPATAASAPTPAVAPAPATAPALERVEITGGSSDTEARRQSTASKIVIGREEIERQGDSTVAEVLKRLPGVTIGGRPGRGGDIRMRGLGGGYTQILVNGERMPPGFALDTLSPEQIERIEIYRAPTAEHGAQAIAGTINLVLREDVKKRLNQVHLSAAQDGGQPQYGLAWTRADQIDQFSYNLSATVFDRRTLEHTDTSSIRTLLSNGALQQEQRDLVENRSHYRGVHLGGRLQWKLGQGESLSLQPFLMHSRSRNISSTARTTVAPGSADSTSRIDSDNNMSFTLARLNTQWLTRLADGSRLDLKAGGHLARSRSDTLRLVDGGTNSQDLSTIHSHGLTQTGKYTHLLDSGHSLGLGWDLEQNQRSEDRTGTQAATPLDEQLQTRNRRAAFWAQDEWEFSPQWSAYAGLRWEGIWTRSIWNATAGSNSGSANHRSSVWSPLLHSVWKLDPAGKDQIRASLTRSYRAPSTMQLAARTLRNEPNSQAEPDRAGNPDLRPELATGLDVAFEHYLPSGGVLSASVFHRRISDYIRSINQLQNGRWVAQPQNIGNASSSGIELEAKLRADELLATTTRLDLRANLSLFRSKVDDVPGPDNRLDRQPSGTANLGADWRLRDWPLTLGGSLNWTPASAVQVSPDERVETGIKRNLEAYALWRLSPVASLRLSGANLTPSDQTSQRSQQDATSIERSRSVTDSRPIWTVRLELKL